MRCLPRRNCPAAAFSDACRLSGPCCLSLWLLNSLNATPSSMDIRQLCNAANTILPLLQHHPRDGGPLPAQGGIDPACLPLHHAGEPAVHHTQPQCMLVDAVNTKQPLNVVGAAPAAGTADFFSTSRGLSQPELYLCWHTAAAGGGNSLNHRRQLPTLPSPAPQNPTYSTPTGSRLCA